MARNLPKITEGISQLNQLLLFNKNFQNLKKLVYLQKQSIYTMKKHITLFLLLCSTLFSYAQDSLATNEAKDSTKIVETQPCFPGCEHIENMEERQQCSNKKMIAFLGQKAGYPRMALESGFEGKVFIRFVVEADGSISNAEILKDQTPGGGLAEASLNAVKAMNDMSQKWIPGTQDGLPVRINVTVPVVFRLGSKPEPKKKKKKK